MSSAPIAGPSTGTALPDVEPVHRHLHTIRHPASEHDFRAYEDLVAFEDEMLAAGYSSEADVKALAQRWSLIRDQMDVLLQHGLVSTETLSLYDSVLETAEAMIESYISNDTNLEDVSKDLGAQLKRILEEDQATAHSRAAKKQKQTPQIKPPVNLKSKPSLQSKRSPIDMSRNTQRKRRIESGVPGQESLKFRPCRDFFMAHLSDPYPSPPQKVELMNLAGITSASLNQWFTNTRRRSQWMEIMKNFANNRKEDMKCLVERALASPDPKYPISEDAREAVFKMRKYVDELAREVVSNDFMDALNKIKDVTDADALKWQEDQRQERKRVAQIKKECDFGTPFPEPPPPTTLPPKVSEKRKKIVSQDDRLLHKHSRQSSASSPQLNPTAYLGERRASLKRRRDESPAVAAATIYPGIDTPAKRPRISTEADDEPHVPPTDLYRRRMGIPDLSAPPLSASSTLVGSDVTDTPSSSMSRSSPFTSLNTSLQPGSPSDTEIDPLSANNSMLALTIFASDAVVDPSELRFDLSSFEGMEAMAGVNPDASCVDWLKSVVPRPSIASTVTEYDPEVEFWEPFSHEANLPFILSPTLSLPSSPAFEDGSEQPTSMYIPSYTPQPPLPIYGVAVDVQGYAQPEHGSGSMQTQEAFTTIPSTDVAPPTTVDIASPAFMTAPQVAMFDSSSYPSQSFDMGYDVSKVTHSATWTSPQIVDTRFDGYLGSTTSPQEQFNLSISYMPYAS